MKIKTEWQYSLRTEAQRVFYTARQIACGFYRVNNFFVLPTGYKSNRIAKVVVFPDINFNQIPRFWERAKLTDPFNSMPFSSKKTKKDIELLSDIENLLENVKLPKANYEKTQETWNNASASVISEIEKIMPEKKGFLKKLTIFPTVLGTTGSFSWIPNKKGEAQIYLRDGGGIHVITEAILTILTRKDVYEHLSGTWAESELLVDWLVTKSSLNKILSSYEPSSNYIPTLKGTRIKQNAKLLKDSDNFYKKLGFSVNLKIFGLQGETPLINERSVQNLTHTEKVILKLLIEKANNVASFDELGDVMFKSEDNFSLYAISKQIERLRDKLEENGVSSSYIQTLRGQGYVLKN